MIEFTMSLADLKSVQASTSRQKGKVRYDVMFCSNAVFTKLTEITVSDSYVNTNK